MLRSFHYASVLALRKGNIRPEDVPTLEPWGRFWQVWVSLALLKAYLEGAQQDAFLPRDRGETAILLAFYMLKRAVTEPFSEMGWALDRVRVAVRGVLQLLESHAWSA